MKIYYSLHNHSCLSPCADNDNTPNNLLGMASLGGIGVMALTDHNSVRNCPAFYAAAPRYGVIPIAGMELTTSEDIHVVFLFYTLEDAMLFGDYIEARRMRIKNRPDIFGEQLILDVDDNTVGTEEHLLPNATSVSIEDVIAIAREFNAVCFPAHIDKDSNSVTAILGTLPKHLEFGCVEVHDPARADECRKKYLDGDTLILFSSDSHYLTDVGDAEHYLEVDTDSSDPEVIRVQFLDLLR